MTALERLFDPLQFWFIQQYWFSPVQVINLMHSSSLLVLLLLRFADQFYLKSWIHVFQVTMVLFLFRILGCLKLQLFCLVYRLREWFCLCHHFRCGVSRMRSDDNEICLVFLIPSFFELKLEQMGLSMQFRNH